MLEFNIRDALALLYPALDDYQGPSHVQPLASGHGRNE